LSQPNPPDLVGVRTQSYPKVIGDATVSLLVMCSDSTVLTYSAAWLHTLHEAQECLTFIFTTFAVQLKGMNFLPKIDDLIDGRENSNSRWNTVL